MLHGTDQLEGHVAGHVVPADDIKARIEAALTREYDADDQHVVVSVEHRFVTLSGTVTSWWYRYLSRNSAWSAPGVEDVRDHLRIEDLRTGQSVRRESLAGGSGLTRPASAPRNIDADAVSPEPRPSNRRIPR